MSLMEISPGNGLYYEWHPPKDEKGVSFVFFNALTGDHLAWEGAIAPACREAGHGTLVFNFRGQTGSEFSPDLNLDDQLITADAGQLLNLIKPPRPVMVGLSIGGLFAAQAILGGVEAAGLVLLNTLRIPGPRLRWINDALVRVAQVGGLELLRDLFLPLLMNQDWLGQNREAFLGDGGYTPLNPDDGSFKLLSEAGTQSNWEINYEKLALPTLVITGQQDHVFYDEADVAALEAKLPNSTRLNLPHVGHLIAGEIPEELARILIGFAGEV